jgi:hypothetical protein
MSITPSVPLRASPIDAAQQAFEHTRRMLFPFRFERWLALGFMAFLDQCGRGGGGVNIPNPGGGWNGGGGSGGRADITRAAEWLGDHVGVVVLVTAVVLTLVIGLTALVLWIGSRGVFMYADNVATGRSDVARPWREHRERANSLFAWRFLISLASIVAVLLLLLMAGLLMLAFARGRLPGATALMLGLLGLLPMLLVLAVSVSLISVALRDFVAPLQMHLGISCGAAARVCWDLVRSQPGAFVLYVVLKIAWVFLVVIALMIAGCLTCCCGFLPVVAQTLLQPAFYFERAWSLFLLRQLGYDLIRTV